MFEIVNGKKKGLLDDYLFPFSKDVGSHVITIVGMKLNTFCSYNSNYQLIPPVYFPALPLFFIEINLITRIWTKVNQDE